MTGLGPVEPGAVFVLVWRSDPPHYARPLQWPGLMHPMTRYAETENALVPPVGLEPTRPFRANGFYIPLRLSPPRGEFVVWTMPLPYPSRVAGV